MSDLARTQRLDLIFDERLLADRTTVAIRGHLTVDDVLRQLLAGTGIGYRRTSESVILLFAQPAGGHVADEGAVADILVIGRLTQNADIRRTENDIQPYRVVSRRDAATTHRDGIDEVLRARETQNDQILSASQDPFTRTGSNQSEIDLRGLGSQQTLVLIDGRRMPSIPTAFQGLQQPDLNAIPLGAIERIETLPSTAGGIYGPGATGGVINVVLRRAYRGAEINVVGGITARGDAARLRTEARIGFTPDGGRTDVMLFASRTASGPIHTGDRDFAERAALRALANSPAAYLARYPVGQGINVFSQGGDLALDSTLGGAALGSPITSLPIGVSGGAVDRTDQLFRRAGQIVTLSPANPGSPQTDLLTKPTLTSAFLNVRHQFGAGIEGYVDGLYLRDASEVTGRTTGSIVAVDADAPGNPFTQPIILTYPVPAMDPPSHTNISEFRVMTGLIVPLFHRWRANLDYSYAETRLDFLSSTTGVTSDLYSAIGTGMLGPSGQPILDPLGDSAGFLRALPQYLESTLISIRRADRRSEGSLRVSGPVLQLPGGMLTLTGLAGVWQEQVPASDLRFQLASISVSTPAPMFSQLDRYAYAEVRAPIVPSDSGLVPLRGLEVQLAARFDSQTTRVPTGASGSDLASTESFRFTRAAAVFTAGLRVFPWPWLILRGSVATGQLPPTVDQIGYAQFQANFDVGLSDVKRGDRQIGSEGSVALLSGGSPTLRPERARSVSFGLVVNPNGGGPRLSVDLTRIDKWDEISTVYSGNLGYFLANEARYPDRVLRAPLTTQDAALGFTAGPITEIDTRSFNSGRTTVTALDVQLDWQVPIGASSSLGTHTKLTWQPTLRRQKAPDLPAFNIVGYADGPLEWRGNVGVDWRRGPLSIGLNGQYFSNYNVANSNFNASAGNPKVVAYQGATKIPAQLYFDLDFRWHFSLPRSAHGVRTGEIALGIVNVADHKPPIIANPDGVGYSTYGDPRGRRFELSISASY
ncbi:TonB-dependent receptor [Sphingomonas glacialis]|uniref:TonB-dependent receptor n=1 Tax=Sphingomonas glacialis TaxID=658225 RepID=UPI0013873813|nr:TonB-dependent receptor [Sphingomonas glacialis]